jgi:hypothetical protein
LRHTARSIVEDREKLILEVERRPPLYKKKLKKYSDRNLKDKLEYGVYGSVVRNWSELQLNRNNKIYVNFIVHVIGVHADGVNILGRSTHTIKKNIEALVFARSEDQIPVRRDFPQPSRPALGPNQPPAQWVPGVSRGQRRPVRDADHPPHLVP